MKTNRTIAAVLAAALTATSMPAYAVDTGTNERYARVTVDGVTLHSEDGRKTDTNVSVNEFGDVIDNGCSGDVYVGSEARHVGNDAFCDNTDITSVTFAEGVEYISDYAFNGCTALKELYIPKSVKEGGICCFYSYSQYSLTDIWYAGTIDDWNRMSEHPFVPNGTTLHCKDAETGEYITACNLYVDFSVIDWRQLPSIHASLQYDSETVYKWVASQYGGTAIAVPMNKPGHKYTVKVDQDETNIVLRGENEGLSFSDRYTAIKKTVIIDPENVLILDGNSDYKIHPDYPWIVRVPGKNAVLSSSDDGTISNLLLRRYEDMAYYALSADKTGECTITVESDDREKPDEHNYSVIEEIPKPTEALDSRSYSKLITMPDDEIAVGDSTDITVEGGAYSIMPVIYKPDGEKTEDPSECENYIEIKEDGIAGNYVKYRITGKKACRVQIRFNDFIYGMKDVGAEIRVAGTDIMGDANSDGRITVSDAVKVLQFVANHDKYPMTEKEQELADIDGFKGVTGSDAVDIQKIDAGILRLD